MEIILCHPERSRRITKDCNEKPAYRQASGTEISNENSYLAFLNISVTIYLFLHLTITKLKQIIHVKRKKYCKAVCHAPSLR